MADCQSGNGPALQNWPAHQTHVTFLDTGSSSEADNNFIYPEQPSPDGVSGYSYSSYSINSVPQLSIIDHDEGPSASSSCSWNIAVSPASSSMRHRLSTREVPNAHLREKLPFTGQAEIQPHVDTHSLKMEAAGALRPKDLGGDAILGRLFEQNPELRHRLMCILRDERAIDNTYLRQKVQELLKDHKPVIAALNEELMSKNTKPNALRTALLSNASNRNLDPDAASLFTQVTVPGDKGNSADGRKTGLYTCWVPEREHSFIPIVSPSLILIMACIAFFMAGGYDEPDGEERAVPFNLREWLSFQQNAGNTFDFNYLLSWGGLYLPAIHNGQGWRWVTSAFIHSGFQHFLANMLLFTTFGGMLEVQYGPVRIFLVAMLALLGAAFFAGVFADECSQVVGASGMVLGFVGLTIVDLLLKARKPIYTAVRLLLTLAAVVLFIVTAFTKAGEFTSNWSHLGGFVCGLFPSFLFMPGFKDERWEPVQNFASRLKARVLPNQGRRTLEAAEKEVAMQSISRTNPTSSPDQTDFKMTGQPAEGTGKKCFEETCLNPTMPFAAKTSETQIFDTAADLNIFTEEGIRCAHNDTIVPVCDEAAAQQQNRQDDWPRAPDLTEGGVLDEGLRNGGGVSCWRRKCWSARGRGILKTLGFLRGRGILKTLGFSTTQYHAVLGAFVVIALFTIFPSYVYLYRLKHLSCPAV